MALLRGFDRFLLFCHVQKAQHTANILLCRVPRSSTRQTLTFDVCLTPAHGKGDDVHGRWDRLGHDFAVCCPKAHGKDEGSPCAGLWAHGEC